MRAVIIACIILATVIVLWALLISNSNGRQLLIQYLIALEYKERQNDFRTLLCLQRIARHHNQEETQHTISRFHFAKTKYTTSQFLYKTCIEHFSE